MPKILTCCYCGTRAALVLDKGRHELTCASCGAQLHNIKQMPVGTHEARDVPGKRPKPMKKQKKKKNKGRKIMSEVFDLLDDIFD